MDNIILIGFMGSGKSTVGRCITEIDTKYKQIDTDWYIEKKYRTQISNIFATKGEAAFRQMETDCLKEILKDENGHYVLSVGGGLPMKDENQKLLHQIGRIVYLRASVDTLKGRLSGDKNRPLLQGGDLSDKITDLMNKRQGTYENLADIIIDTDNMTIEDVIEIIMREIQ